MLWILINYFKRLAGINYQYYFIIDSHWLIKIIKIIDVIECDSQKMLKFYIKPLEFNDFKIPPFSK